MRGPGIISTMSSALPLILLPPSEGKASGGHGAPWAPGTMAIDLDARRAKVMTALARAMRGNEAARAKLLGVKGTALAAATLADRTIRESPTMPGIDRYAGVLYEALDLASLTAAERSRLDRSVVIVSGLWGAVAPTDPIPDYRLRMGASLPGLGKLSTWWRDDLSAALTARAGGERLWNLLPNEHAAAWRVPGGLPQISVRFLEHAADGSLTAVSHRNKFLKGALVRYLLGKPGAGPNELARWKHPSGFRLDADRTEERAGATVVTFVQAT